MNNSINLSIFNKNNLFLLLSLYNHRCYLNWLLITYGEIIDRKV